MRITGNLSCSWVLNQDLQDFEDFLALDIGLDGARSSWVLNQDLQDFED